MKFFKRGRGWFRGMVLLLPSVAAVVGSYQIPQVQDVLLRQPAQLHPQAVTPLPTLANQPLLFASGSYVQSTDRLQRDGPEIPFAGWVFYKEADAAFVQLVQRSPHHQYQYQVPNQAMWCVGDRVLVLRQQYRAEAELRFLARAPDAKSISLGLTFIGAYPAQLLDPLADSSVYLRPVQRKITDLWGMPAC